MSRHCVVLAGGLGTRLREVTGGLIPKAMVPVNGRPFIDYKLYSLYKLGVTDVTLLVGELGSQIQAHLKDFKLLNVRIVYDGDTLLGTGGSIRSVADELPQYFWVTYGDTYVVADLDAAESEFQSRGGRVMTVWKNADFLETSNVTISGSQVVRYEKQARPGSHQWLDYGLIRFDRVDFMSFAAGETWDLSEVLTRLIDAGELGAWEVATRFWDVGTPHALAWTEGEFRSRDWDGLW